MSKMLEQIYEQPYVLNKVYHTYANEIADFSEKISQCHNFYLIGTGSSLLACEASFAAFVTVLGKSPVILHSADMPLYIGIFKENDIIILVSQSGESAEIIAAVDMLKNTKAEIWALTNERKSHLAMKADNVLYIYAGHEDSSATKTYTASLMVLNMLSAGKSVEKLKSLGNIPEDVERDLDLSKNFIENISGDFKDIENMYLLGLGPNVATAKEASLMMKEKARIHAEGGSLIEFRHGPIEVCEKGTKLIIITYSINSHENVLMHKRDLNGTGADVYLITSGVGADAIDLNLKCSVDNVYSTITSIVPFQLLAEKTAFKKGYDIDGFRYINKVLNKYSI